MEPVISQGAWPGPIIGRVLMSPHRKCHRRTNTTLRSDTLRGEEKRGDKREKEEKRKREKEKRKSSETEEDIWKRVKVKTKKKTINTDKKKRKKYI